MREEHNIFDEFVKNRLEDAQVSAPEFVWDEVKSRLDCGRESSRQFFPVWGSVLAVCAMAVVAAVLFIRPVSHNVDVVESRQTMALTCNVMPSVIERIDTDIKPVDGLRGRIFLSVVAAPADKAVEDSKTMQSSIQQQEEVASNHSDIAQDIWDDPFSEMMAEDLKAARVKREPVSVKLGGEVGANDAHSNSFMSRPLWSSGYVHDGVNENSVSSFMIPVSLGVSLRYPVSDRFAIGVGIDWTMLNRKFDGSYKTADGEFTHSVNYIGIPLTVYYNVLQTKSFSLYAYGGGSIDKLISSKYYLLSESSAPIARDSAKGVQFGVRAGFGCSFRLTDLLSIYFDPYVGYYFPGNQPKTLRTEHPLMVSFEAGLKFSL